MNDDVRFALHRAEQIFVAAAENVEVGTAEGSGKVGQEMCSLVALNAPGEGDGTSLSVNAKSWRGYARLDNLGDKIRHREEPAMLFE
jgi:hypothetical protein